MINSEEFKEIELSGGKIEFIKNGEAVSMRYTHSTPFPVTCFTANISSDGVYLIEDSRTAIKLKDQFSIATNDNPLPAYIISDKMANAGPDPGVGKRNAAP